MIHPDELTSESCAAADRSGLRLLALMLCSIPILFGCAWLQATQAEPCTPTDLAAIEVAYVAESIQACRAEGADADTCKALPAIQEKYRAKRAAYVECRP